MRRLVTVLLIIGVLLGMTLATTPAQAELSAGCSDLNDPYYDGFYGSSGNRNDRYRYVAGERIRIQAGPPDDFDPTTIVLFDNSNGGEQVASASYPGTLTYVIPATGDYNFGWTVAANATFMVSCMSVGPTPTTTATTTATVTPTATATPTAYDEIEVVVRAFIPCEAVQSPTDIILPYIGEVFGGDRPPLTTGGGYRAAFSYDDPRVRFEEGVQVTADPQKSPLVSRTRSRMWTPTRLFTRAQTARLQGAWWCWGIVEDTPIDYVPATVSVNDGAARVEGTDEGVQITFAMHAGNAYPPLGAFRIPNPIVNADFTVSLRQRPGESPEYRIQGTHDGFPAYEIYINGQRVYECDPLANGDSPRSLYPPQDKRASVSWTIVPTAQHPPAYCAAVSALAIAENRARSGSTLGLLGTGLSSSNPALSQSTPITMTQILVNGRLVGVVPLTAQGSLEAILDTRGASDGLYEIQAVINGQVVAQTQVHINQAAPLYQMIFQGQPLLGAARERLMLPLVVR